jgi:hypothetical protein
MRVEQLAHVLRAAADILGQSDFLVIGSAAILASYPDEELPIEATRSEEADLAPFDDPDGSKADRIDGAIGEASPFHTLHGYYAQGVGPETAKLPDGWRSRLVPFEAPGLTSGRGFCLEPHDLAASKLVAGRIKDFEFVEALIELELLDPLLLLSRVNAIPRHEVPAQVLSRARSWVQRRLPKQASSGPIRAPAPSAGKSFSRVSRCRVCQRPLRSEASIHAGIGPVCLRKN